MRGYIQWFDATSGEGMVEAETGESFYLHYSCIDGVDKNGYAHPTAGDQSRLRGIAGTAVDFTLYTNLYSSRVDWCQLFA